MKWLRFRHKFASGPSDWSYRPLYKNRLSKAEREEIEEEMEELTREYNYSDKYRGIEWQFLPTKKVPNKHIELALRGLMRRIKWYRDSIKECRESLPILSALIGKGRKTCPDQVRHEKYSKMIEEQRNKRIKEVEKKEKCLKKSKKKS